MLTEHSVADAARSAGFDPALASFVPSTGSTNSDLIERSNAGAAPDWTVLVAGHQSQGRGRLGRGWDAPAGTALLVSVVVPAPNEPSTAPLVSFAAAVAMVDALTEACGVRASCKWPNDVMVGERKIAGILAEARAQAGAVGPVVVGAGVNVLQSESDLPPSARTAATSVAIEGGSPNMVGLLGSYLTRLRRVIEPPLAADGAGIATFPERVLAPYRARCSTLGRNVLVRTADGVEVTGTALAVGPLGELLVQSEHGPVTVTFGEVVHLGMLAG
jgi:BirA family biotin operon repressor/biotin-[acetyl-CoA-carboxylase] ligase